MTKARLACLIVCIAVALATQLAASQNPPAQPPAGATPLAGRGRGGPGRGGPRGMKTLLIWADTRNGIGQHDSTGHAIATIERLGYESGTYFSYIRTDSAIISYHPQTTTGQPASGGPNLGMIDAIFFMGHREVPIDADQKAALMKFVHDDGKGFVAAHAGSTAFESWPDFGEMLGGGFDQHPWGVANAQVVVEDPKFPGMQYFAPVFDMREEFYQIKNFSPAKSHILMRLDTSKLDMTLPTVQKADAPYALTWAKMYGKGRVFYSALGHDASTWDDANIQRMYFDAIKWAMGLSDADVTPRQVSTGSPAGSAAP